MNMFSYSITTHFILNNKYYYSCCNPHTKHIQRFWYLHNNRFQQTMTQKHSSVQVRKWRLITLSFSCSTLFESIYYSCCNPCTKRIQRFWYLHNNRFQQTMTQKNSRVQVWKWWLITLSFSCSTLFESIYFFLERYIDIVNLNMSTNSFA